VKAAEVIFLQVQPDSAALGMCPIMHIMSIQKSKVTWNRSTAPPLLQDSGRITCEHFAYVRTNQISTCADIQEMTAVSMSGRPYASH
jgi:hypothetical protein